MCHPPREEEVKAKMRSTETDQQGATMRQNASRMPEVLNNEEKEDRRKQQRPHV